jgi:hypothetical protein
MAARKENTMNKFDQMLLILGRMEGQLSTIASVSERVTRLELWQNRLKGAFTALAGVGAWLGRHAFGR